MGYRGSKSKYNIILCQTLSKRAIKFSNFVKEQRVDGSCFIKSKIMKLRCTLMGCASCYPINIPSKQIIIQTRDFLY